MTPIDSPKLIFMPDSNFLRAGGIVMAYHDRWWTCHPETNAILFYHVHLQTGKTARLQEASPQCNGQQQTAILLTEKLYPWAAVRFVPLVLQPINPADYL